MQSSIDKDIILVKLEDGEDLFPSLEEIIAKYKIGSGMFLGAVGMLENFEIGYFTGTEYIGEFHKTPHELLHLGGSIAQVEGRPMLHIHCSLAGPDYTVMGGHLKKAKVKVLNEIFIRRFNDVMLTRELNPGTELWELKIVE